MFDHFKEKGVRSHFIIVHCMLPSNNECSNKRRVDDFYSTLDIHLPLVNIDKET